MDVLLAADGQPKQKPLTGAQWLSIASIQAVLRATSFVALSLDSETIGTSACWTQSGGHKQPQIACVFTAARRVNRGKVRDWPVVVCVQLCAGVRVGICRFRPTGAVAASRPREELGTIVMLRERVRRELQ